jgi:hypothetical protein
MRQYAAVLDRYHRINALPPLSRGFHDPRITEQVIDDYQGRGLRRRSVVARSVAAVASSERVECATSASGRIVEIARL